MIPGLILNPSDPRGLVMLKWVSCYFLLGAITMPFVNEFWIIEFPVLTMFQWPQVALASWIRQRLSGNLTLPFGLDGGVRSPAAIYALCLADLGILALTLGPIGLRTRKLLPYGRWTAILVGMVALDAAAILWFHYKRLGGLSIY